MSEEFKYAIFMETNDEMGESWYFFIRYQGNEENLNHLQQQLEMVDWYLEEDLSTFDLEIEYPVSENTAREMIKVDLNSCSRHRKFDGVLKKIDLEIKKNQKTIKQMKRTFKKLGKGKIERYLSEEDYGSEQDEAESEGESTEYEDDDFVEEKKIENIPANLQI